MNHEISILELLARSLPSLVREIPLRNRLEIEMGNAVSLAFLSTKLRGLEASGDVLAISNADSGNQWTITAAGQARLALAKA